MDRREFVKDSFLALLGVTVAANTPAPVKAAFNPPAPRTAGRINPRTASVDELWEFIKPFTRTKTWYAPDMRAHKVATVLALYERKRGRTVAEARNPGYMTSLSDNAYERPELIEYIAQLHKERITGVLRTYHRLDIIVGKLVALA